MEVRIIEEYQTYEDCEGSHGREYSRATTRHRSVITVVMPCVPRVGESLDVVKVDNVTDYKVIKAAYSVSAYPGDDTVEVILTVKKER